MAKRHAIAVLKFEGGRLAPASYTDRVALAQVPADALLECHLYSAPRNARQNRYLHALLETAAENSPDGWHAETIKQAVKLRGGWVEGVLTRRDGSSAHIFRSTADFTKEEMAAFTDQVVDYVQANVCPGVDVDAWRREALARCEQFPQFRARKRA